MTSRCGSSGTCTAPGFIGPSDAPPPRHPCRFLGPAGRASAYAGREGRAPFGRFQLWLSGWCLPVLLPVPLPQAAPALIMPTRQKIWQDKQVADGCCRICAKPNPDAGKRKLCPDCDVKQRISAGVSILRRYAPEFLIPEKRNRTKGRYVVPKRYKPDR